MAISTDYRKKDVQKNVEKQLASVTAAYLRGYVKLAKGSGTMEVNPNVLKDSIIKYVAEVSKGTSLVELDAEGKPQQVYTLQNFMFDLHKYILHNDF